MGAASSNRTISTIQSYETTNPRADSGWAVSVGIFAGIVPLFRSPVTLAVSQTDFSLPSLHPKIPLRGAGFRSPTMFGNPGILDVVVAQQRADSSPARNYRGFNPSASNCWFHSAGPSRSRWTPMPRSSRPSTAALTRSGARNASEIVRLT